MNFVDKDGTTKVYIPVHPWLSHSDLGLSIRFRSLEVIRESCLIELLLGNILIAQL